MKETCRFCNIINGGAEGEENRPICENNSFFSLPSIGALVKGWVLIVPKNHVISMKELYNENGFIDFTNNMLNAMRHQYTGSFIAFEHGPNNCLSSTSCGTNHAHLHLVPYPKSLYNDMLGTDLIWEKCTASQISSIAGTHEYLFYTEILAEAMWEDPKGFIHILERPISQYFRRLIAKQMNCAEEYDYKRYARIDVAIETGSVLSRIVNL